MKHINSFEKGQTLISPEIQPNQSFVNGHNGQLNFNGRELTFTNKNGTLQISTTTEFQNVVKEIVGDFAFEDELILFTKDILNESLGHVFSVKETSENNYSFTKIHTAEYNFSTGIRLATVGVNENKNYKRVYFSDGEQPFRSINVIFPNLSNLEIDELNIFPEVTMNPPLVEEIVNGGSLVAMSVQYCYRLTNFNGNVTKFSFFSDRTVILNEYSNNKLNDTAGVPGDNLGKSVKITISDIDFSKFKTIEAFAILYEIKDTVTSVKSLGTVNLSSNSVFFKHTGNESDANVSIDEILANSDNFKTVKVLQTYENLLLAGNVSYEEIQDYDFDCFVKQSNSSGNVFTEDYNPNPKEYRYIPGTDIIGGESESFSTGNGVRVSFITEKEEMADDSYISADFPNPRIGENGISDNENPQLANNFDSFGNKTFKQSIRYSPNKASYQRGEVYRLAFKATKERKDSFVKYIGDFQVPKIDDLYTDIENPTNNNTDNRYQISKVENNKLLGQAIYFRIEVKLPQQIIDNYDFFEILRVERTEEDKNIVDQGVLFPVADLDENNSFYDENDFTYPSSVVYKNGIELPKRISFLDLVGLYFCNSYYKLGNTFSFDSPKVVNQLQNYNSLDGMNLNLLTILKYLKYENKIIDGEELNDGQDIYYSGKWHRHILYYHDQFLNKNIPISNNYFAGYGEIIPKGKFPDKDTYGLGNFGISKFSAEKEGLDFYSPNKNNNRVSISYGEPTFFLQTSLNSNLIEFNEINHTLNNYVSYPFLNSRGMHFRRTGSANSNLNVSHLDDRYNEGNLGFSSEVMVNFILVNLERNVINQYGGLNEFAISQNQFKSIYKQKINGYNYDLTVGNGDIYIDLFHHQKFSLKDAPDLSKVITYEDSTKWFSTTSSYSVVLETELPQIFAKGDKLIKSGINPEEGENYIYNDAYISQEAKVSISKPFNFQEVTEFPNLIQVSDIKLNGDQNDSWGIFKSDNFHELDLNKGAITNLIKIKDLIFATQSNEGLSQIFINPRAIIPTSDGRNITIGSDSPVNIEYSKEISKYGTEFYNSIAISDTAFMFFNNKFKKIILFKNGVVSITDLTFNQNKFYEKLKGKNINNVSGVYDERYSEMILSFIIDNNDNFSISYNEDEKFNSFNGSCDLISSHFINFQNKIFAKHNLKELHIKNEGPKGSYFNEVKNFEIEFIVNPSIENVKIFDNFIGVIKSSNIKFKELRFFTNLVPEQILYANDNRYKIREGRHLIPYREKGKIRMRGDYMNVKIIFDNLNNVEISIASILSIIRKSFK